MTVRQDYVHEICQGFTSFIETLPYDVSLKYIFHNRGQREDAIALENRFFDSHPAGAIALKLLHKCKNTPNSTFHGLAIETMHTMMGLREKKNALGIITINLDNHTTTESVLHEVYHLGWMAIDAAKLLQHPKYKNTLKSGSLMPKRSALNFAKATLQADIFAALVLADHGFDTMIKRIASKRCMDAMSPHINGQPWHYPYPLAYETTRHTWDTLIDRQSSSYHPISTSFHYAHSITSTIEEEAYQQWWDFCHPAQAMAWYNETPDYILSAALHTSDDPIIKVTSLLIQDCTGLTLSEEDIDTNRYNAFISEEDSRLYHEKAIEETFELVLSQSLKEQSAQVFLDTASRQNNKLTEGKIFGWCALPLQIAAKSFETKSQGGQDIKTLLTLGFRGSEQDLKYDSLVSLGDSIIQRRKNGEIITLEDVEEMARAQTSSEFVATSVRTTIEEPAHQKALEATQNFECAPTLEPSAPAPAPQAQPTPTASQPAAMPAMGGGMMGGSGGVALATPPPTKTTTEDKKKAE